MEYFSDEHSKLLLSKEWLVKIDNEKSIPYLLKFYSSAVDLCCYIVITDTKNVWAEVLTSNQLARRWRECNSLEVPASASEAEEEDWRAQILELLSVAHTAGGIMDMSFDVVESRYADFAFELGGPSFKWRWETNHTGPKISADILSKHLIMPLISVVHLTFSSPDAASKLSESDLEKAVDKVGRTARRTVDTHIRNAISKPRVATTLRRMTAMFNFVPDLPPIVAEVSKPEFSIPSPPTSKSRARAKSPPARSDSSPSSKPQGSSNSKDAPRETSPKPSSQPRPKSLVPDEGSVTERSSDDELPGLSGKGVDRGPREALKPVKSMSPLRSMSPERGGTKSNTSIPPRAETPPRPSARASSPDSSPPRRPSKKPKRDTGDSSSDDDSEEGSKRTARSKSNAPRGAKQPLKRGGRRF